MRYFGIMSVWWSDFIRGSMAQVITSSQPHLQLSFQMSRVACKGRTSSSLHQKSRSLQSRRWTPYLPLPLIAPLTAWFGPGAPLAQTLPFICFFSANFSVFYLFIIYSNRMKTNLIAWKQTCCAETRRDHTKSRQTSTSLVKEYICPYLARV